MSSEATGKQPAKIDSAQKERDRKTAMRLFIGAALDMSWQMAIVVLVPIIGGVELDKHWHTTPWLTISGFILAMFGTYLVIKRMLAAYGNLSLDNVKDKK
jgi:F0F1-type ATP synthase assembly protein I